MADKEPPKDLSGKKMWTELARKIRDHQWEMMEKMERFGTLYIDPWNRGRRDQLEDEERFGLLGWMETGTWFEDHEDWFIIGDWDEELRAWPYQITDAGRAALQDRERYDMEPVRGGLVEPGWQATPEAKAT